MFHKKPYLCIALLITIFSVCSSAVKIEESVVVEKSHIIYISGVVKSINSYDVDKSGKNRKIMLNFILKIESYDDGAMDTVLDNEVKFIMKEKDLLLQTRRQLQTGDKVSITSQVIEKNPKVIAVSKIRFLENQ